MCENYKKQQDRWILVNKHMSEHLYILISAGALGVIIKITLFENLSTKSANNQISTFSTTRYN